SKLEVCATFLHNVSRQGRRPARSLFPPLAGTKLKTGPMDHRLKGRAPGNRITIFTCAVAALLVAAGPLACAQSGSPEQPLQVSISLETPVVTEPLAARVTIHLHNRGNQALWLYEPVRDASEVSANPADAGSGGPALAVHLQPASQGPAPASSSASAGVPAVGTVLENPGFPHPQLVSLAPGADLDETAAIRIGPARSSGAAGAFGGAYRVSVSYSARYHNGDALRRDLGVDLWQGLVQSNSVLVTLKQMPAANHCSIEGATFGSDMAPDADILVSLSDDQQHLLAQTLSAADGGFYFEELPPGRYWVTVRREHGTADTGFFEHADLTDSQPEARLKLIMLNEEVYDAKRLLHKPVLFRISDKEAKPVTDATLEILWTSGTVVDNVKARTSDDGLAVVNLLPGTNYVTVRKHGCAKDEELASVSPGGGIDGFSYTLDCAK
ncbi:MAG: MSCRAMM family protein, partial [Terriglobia bacterium]